MKDRNAMSRRQFIQYTAALAAAVGLPRGSHASPTAQIKKTIAKSGEKIAVIGMGTSRTFDVDPDSVSLTKLQQVTQLFFDMGGQLIDSSPMYGSAEKVLGVLLANIKNKQKLFAATKVWIEGKQAGEAQMERSRQLWGIKQFELMQIHNLLDWETHLDTLKQMKAEGKIRYIGITTSHGRFHDRLYRILKNNDLDFVQLSYNIANRQVESPLLSLAQDKGVAVIVNRPFQRGELFRQVKGQVLPAWAEELDCHSWGQFFLKYVVSHPAVSCVIPATSKVKHMRDNMQAGMGHLPTSKQRKKMQDYFIAL